MPLMIIIFAIGISYEMFSGAETKNLKKQLAREEREQSAKRLKEIKERK